MVTISDVRKSKNSTTNEEFISLVLQGDVELVLSKETGRMYATARTCIISSTFSEAVALTLIGKQLPGSIQKIPCAEYDYIVPESGEIVRLSHTYEYVPDNSTSTQTYQTNSSSTVEAKANTFSSNGTQELVGA